MTDTASYRPRWTTLLSPQGVPIVVLHGVHQDERLILSSTPRLGSTNGDTYNARLNHAFRRRIQRQPRGSPILLPLRNCVKFIEFVVCRRNQLTSARRLNHQERNVDRVPGGSSNSSPFNRRLQNSSALIVMMRDCQILERIRRHEQVWSVVEEVRSLCPRTGSV